MSLEESLGVLFFAALFMGGIGAAIGQTKGRAAFGLVLGLLVGPLGWIIVLLLPSEGQRKCPECLGVIPPAARRCQHCGHQFEPAADRAPAQTRRAYYIQPGEKPEGPYTIGQLKAMESAGRITRETLCTREGDADWYPIGILLE